MTGAHPPTVRGCVTVASGVEGLAAAEALARRIAAAFEQPEARIVWNLATDPEPLHGTGWTRDVREALALRTARARKKVWSALHGKLFNKLQPTFGATTGYVAEIEGLRQLWGEQSPNPFETVLELLSTGYVFIGIIAGRIVLLAPLVRE